MPRYLDNYKLELIENVSYDKSNHFTIKVEHYQAKEIHTGENFILKRFKINSSLIPQQTKQLQLSCEDQQLFDKLTNETLILKILEHKSIPKCLRILKTSNSVYFVFQEYSLNSVRNYLKQNFISLDESKNIFYLFSEFTLSAKIIEPLLYIHSKKVIYKAINMDNIYVDSLGNVFFTNFKLSIYFENLQTTQKSLETIKKEREFLALAKEDVLDLAKLLYEIFEFDKINHNEHFFKNSAEKKLYNHLTDILKRISSPNTLEVLLKIVNEKENIRTTASTDEPESPTAPYLKNIKGKKGHLRTSTSIEYDLKSFRASMTGFNRSLKNSLSPRPSLLQSQRVFSKESSTTLYTSQSRLTSSIKFESFRHRTKQLTERLTMQSIRTSRETEVSIGERDQQQKKTLQAIIKNRKLLQLITKCMSQISIKPQTINCITLFLLKCEELSTKIKENSFLTKNPAFYKEKKGEKFISIVDNENAKIEEFISIMKIFLVEMINSDLSSCQESFKSFEEYCKKNRIGEIEENLSNEIYTFIDKEMKILKTESSQNSISTYLKNKPKSTNSDQTDQKNSIKNNINSQISSLNCLEYEEKFKWLYFMSIKLKYNNFEKFFDKKISTKSRCIDMFKESYFHQFQSQSIPIEQIIDEIKLRMDKFSRKCNPSMISVK